MGILMSTRILTRNRIRIIRSILCVYFFKVPVIALVLTFGSNTLVMFYILYIILPTLENANKTSVC